MKTILFSIITSSCLSIFIYRSVMPVAFSQQNLSHICISGSENLIEKNLQLKINNLSDENKSLLLKIEILEDELIKQPKRSSHSVSVEASEDLASNQIMKNLSIEKSNEKISNWITTSIKENPGFDFGNTLKMQFDAEKQDTDWAPTQERKLTSLLNDDNRFAGIALKNVQCHSTRCQLSLSAENIAQANLIAEKASRALYENNEQSQVIAVPDITHSTTILYLGRDEKGFDLNN